MGEDHPLEKRYSVAVEAGQIGIWTWARAGATITWDDQARSVMGLAADTRLGLDELASLVDTAHRQRFTTALGEALGTSGNGRLEIETQIRRPSDGKLCWVLFYGHVEADGEGPRRICGAVRDVTTARRGAAETENIEARLSAIVSIAADAIITLDAQQCITMFNDGAEQMFGYARRDVLGKPIAMLMPERYRAAHADHVAAFGQEANTSRRMAERREIFALRMNGEEFPAEASISHVEVAGERIYTAVLRDVGERKRTLDLLAASRTELEQRVAERTAELKAEMERREATQAQLVRTQRMEAFGQLTGGVAHDFNNLLTVITGNLELLGMRLDDERSRTLLKRAEDAAEMGARLTSRLLTFARRRQFAPAPLDLNEQVLGLVDLLGRTLGEDVDLNARLAPSLWTVKADASEIENALLNLAINARDAMPKGGQLALETSNVEAEAGRIGTIEKLPAGQYVRLAVSDTGGGMTREVLQHAFEPFFTTKPPGKGTGLGLSTIYGFAQQSGGTATIYSEPGKGTTVSIYLPRVDGPVSAARAADPSQLPRANGETVLLVEDNTEVRDVTAERLRELGYQVLLAGDGPSALALLADHPEVDLVLSDVVMPGGLSGFDVARRVASDHARCRILLTSGYPGEILRGEAAEAQALPILRKPYGRAELARAVRAALDTDAGGA